MGLLSGSPVGGGGGGGSSFSSLSEDADDHLTHTPTSDAGDSFVIQNASSQNLLEADTTNGKVVVRQPGGTAGTDELEIYHNGTGVRFNDKRTGGTSSKFAYVFKAGGDAYFILGNEYIALNQGQYIADSNDNELLAFSSNASAVDHFQFTNSASGNTPVLSVVGGDTNIDLGLSPKGTGLPDFQNATTSASASAGSNGDVPNQVDGYLSVKIDGTEHKIPFYQT